MRRLLMMVLVIGVCSSSALASLNVRSIPLGDNGSEDTLQEVLDRITVGLSGQTPGHIDAVNDQINEGLFSGGASGGSIASFIIEIAGFANQNSFGIFSANDPSNRAEIFSGSNTGHPGSDPIAGTLDGGSSDQSNRHIFVRWQHRG